MKKKQKKISGNSDYSRKFTAALFVLYLIALSWGILFKFRFNLTSLYHSGTRVKPILKPYFFKEIHFYKADVYSNIIAFVPFGIYLSMLMSKGKTAVRIAASVGIISATSFVYELAQYVFAIGCADISDLINNTVGGIIGIILYYIIKLALRKHTDRVINIFAGVATVVTAGLLAVWCMNGYLLSVQGVLVRFFNSLPI